MDAAREVAVRREVLRRQGRLLRLDEPVDRGRRAGKLWDAFLIGHRKHAGGLRNPCRVEPTRIAGAVGAEVMLNGGVEHLRADFVIEAFDLRTADAAFHQVACVDKHGIAFGIPRADVFGYWAGIPSPFDIGRARDELWVSGIVTRPGMSLRFNKKWPFTSPSSAHQFSGGLIHCPNVRAVDDRGFDIQGPGNI